MADVEVLEAGCLTVGVIDNDPDYLGQVTDIGRGRNVDLKITTSAAECLKWVEEGEIDALFADLRMPGEDGLSIVERAQSLRDIGTVVLTGHEATKEENRRAERLGVTIYQKDSLSDLLDDFGSEISQIEARNLRRRVIALEKMNQEWAEDLLEKLEAIPELKEAIISSEGGDFTISDLIEDIRGLRPRGREYIRLWRRTLDTLLKLRRKK